MCTTFATEVVVRKGPMIEIVCTISAYKRRSETQKKRLKDFRETFTSHEAFDFGSVIEKAKRKMALDSDQINTIQLDTLRVCYTGPDLPPLTIVDLPGMFEQDPEDPSAAARVDELVANFMSNQKSIILAVVQVGNDFNNQKVSKRLGIHDPKGLRTLGIITKPDRAERGSPDETQALKLVKNEQYNLKHGWHAVRNRSHETRNQNNAERDETERQFFSTGQWAAVPRNDVGISALRIKLSHMLLEHIGKELPSLVKALQSSIAATKSSLNELGDARDTNVKKRSYLTIHAERFQSLTQDALRGIYSNKFFALPSSTEPSTARLRTEIQNLNLAFAEVMYKKGQTWTIVDSATNDPDTTTRATLSSSIDEEYQDFCEPTHIKRDEFLEEHIATCVRNSRPAGLPSLVNPCVIGEVFQKQSEPWQMIAQFHLERVFQAVTSYFEEALRSLMKGGRTWQMLMRKHIYPELDRRWVAVESKLAELLVPYTESVPIIYDPTFVCELEQTRKARYEAQAHRLGGSGPFLAPNMKSASTGSQQQLLTEIDNFTNVEILDLMQTYYKRALTVFISNVTVLAIENCMIKDLNSIFSPSLIASMSDEKISAIAAESEDTQRQRHDLRQKLEVLESGKVVLHEHIASQPPSRTTQIPTTSASRSRFRPSTPVLKRDDKVNESNTWVEDVETTPPASLPVSVQKPRSRVDSLTNSPLPAKPSRKRSPLSSPPRNTLAQLGQDLVTDDEY